MDGVRVLRLDSWQKSTGESQVSKRMECPDALCTEDSDGTEEGLYIQNRSVIMIQKVI